MKLKLIRPTLKDKDKIEEMLLEWNQDVEKNGGRKHPGRIFEEYDDFQTYIDTLETEADPKQDLVKASTFFALDEERDVIVGATQIRYELNDFLYLYGGHIGDGVRPSERRKGYATAIISESLKFCKEIGIDRVLITCAKDNIGSAKSIINNGGILENEVEHDGEIMQRYWIEL